MSLRKTLVMVVALLALGAYVYFVEFARDREEAEKKKFFALDKEAVTEVMLTYPDRVIHLKKETEGKWRITQPIEVEADDAAVNNLITAIADAEIKRTLEETPQDVSVYGLNAPVVKLQVSLKEGKTLPLVTIGRDTPVGFSVYVQREGDAKVLLAPQAFRIGMQKEVKDLRDRTIITYGDDEVKKVEIQGPDKDIVLSKVNADWTMEKPVNGKADDTEVRTFLSSLRAMRAQDFLEPPLPDPKEAGLAPPELSVSLSVGEDGAQKTVLVGGEKTDAQGGKLRYVKRGEKDTFYLVGDWVLRDLNKTANDFRDKTVARFTPDQAAKVEVKRQDGDGFTLTRGMDRKWGIDKTLEGTPKEAMLGQFVNDMHELRGFEVAADDPGDLSAYDLQEPAVSVAVYDDKGTKLAAFQAGQKSEGDEKKAFARAEGGKTVFALRDYVFDRLNKKPVDFWEKPAEKSAEKKEGVPSSVEDEAERGGEESN